jgi:hypothetical protein
LVAAITWRYPGSIAESQARKDTGKW